MHLRNLYYLNNSLLCFLCHGLNVSMSCCHLITEQMTGSETQQLCGNFESIKSVNLGENNKFFSFNVRLETRENESWSFCNVKQFKLFYKCRFVHVDIIQIDLFWAGQVLGWYGGQYLYVLTSRQSQLHWHTEPQILSELLSLNNRTSERFRDTPTFGKIWSLVKYVVIYILLKVVFLLFQIEKQKKENNLNYILFLVTDANCPKNKQTRNSTVLYTS